MAVIFPRFDESGFAKWISTRPAIIQELAKKVMPNRLYRLTTTGHYCYLYSWSENGTVTVVIDRKYNPHIFMERRVFGINPDDLVECDIPEKS